MVGTIDDFDEFLHAVNGTGCAVDAAIAIATRWHARIVRVTGHLHSTSLGDGDDTFKKASDTPPHFVSAYPTSLREFLILLLHFLEVEITVTRPTAAGATACGHDAKKRHVVL